VPVSYQIDDDLGRIDRDAVWQFLSTDAYWEKWRSRADVDRQIDGAWRVVGAYAEFSGELVGFARAVSDAVSFAYLADVFVLPAHRGHGIGRMLLEKMIDDGPGSRFRWILNTRDAHGLYRKFGFAEPDSSAMVRNRRP
jgi:GNAT superfamily N-acetyltransferase